MTEFHDEDVVGISKDDPYVNGTVTAIMGISWRSLSKETVHGMGTQIDVLHPAGATVMVVRDHDRTVLRAFKVPYPVNEPLIRRWYSRWVKDNMEYVPL